MQPTSKAKGCHKAEETLDILVEPLSIFLRPPKEIKLKTILTQF